jgi:hypothetical protein
VWLFGPGFNRGQAIQQERVRHVNGGAEKGERT